MTTGWSPQQVQPGDELVATDALGREHPATAVSGYEGTHGGHRDGSYGRIHDFPIVWIRISGSWERVPWPVESLRPAEVAL